jgi:hypothetical protein
LKTPYSERFMRYIVGLLLVLAMLTVAEAGPASIEGSWSGSGTVSTQGAVDRVHCRVRCTSMSKNSYAVSSVCATESGHYDITGQVTGAGSNRYQGTVISGNENGRVLIFNRGSHLSVSVTSPRGSARITLSRR